MMYVSLCLYPLTKQLHAAWGSILAMPYNFHGILFNQLLLPNGIFHLMFYIFTCIFKCLQSNIFYAGLYNQPTLSWFRVAPKSWAEFGEGVHQCNRFMIDLASVKLLA